MDCSQPGSLVHRISQARILDWVAICFSGGSSWPRDQTHISCMTSGFFTTRDSGRPIPWLRNSNRHHQPHRALPRDWVISVPRLSLFPYWQLQIQLHVMIWMSNTGSFAQLGLGHAVRQLWEICAVYSRPLSVLQTSTCAYMLLGRAESRLPTVFLFV